MKLLTRCCTKIVDIEIECITVFERWTHQASVSDRLQTRVALVLQTSCSIATTHSLEITIPQCHRKLLKYDKFSTIFSAVGHEFRGLSRISPQYELRLVMVYTIVYLHTIALANTERKFHMNITV